MTIASIAMVAIAKAIVIVIAVTAIAAMQVVIVPVIVVIAIRLFSVIMKIDFEEMQVFDFSNLNLQETNTNNCYGCDDSCNCDNGCDSGDCYS